MSEADAVADVAQIPDHVAGGVALMMDALRTGATTFEGAWRSTQRYTRGDLVASDGVVWRAVRDVASGGSAPTEGAEWTEVSGLRVGVLSLLAALLRPGQDLEDAAHPLVTLGLDDSADHALTQVGELVGLRRRDATQISDARYRVALRAWVRAMRSNGTIPDIEAVAAILAGGDGFELDEYFPAGVLVTPDAALGTDDAYVGAIARAVRSAGVRLQVICPPPGDAFTFAGGDEEPEASATLGWSNATQTTGGYLAGVVE